MFRQFLHQKTLFLTESPPWIPDAGAWGRKGGLAFNMEHDRPHEPQADEPRGVRQAIPPGVP